MGDNRADTDLPAGRQDPDVQPATASAEPASARVPTPSVSGKARPALPEVYEQCFGYVWTCLKRLGVWDRDLEDAVHDVFLVVHRRLADYDPDRPIKPWLAGISARVASEFRRRAQHRREVVTEDVEMEAQSTIPSQDAALSEKQRRDLVMRGLDRLDIDRRTVLVLHDIEGYAMPEIATSLDVNVNTLYARLRAARADFAAAVKALSTNDTGGVSS
jgi:RNA polymerase sigma-70 factor (ECF subfamily)